MHIHDTQWLFDGRWQCDYDDNNNVIVQIDRVDGMLYRMSKLSTLRNVIIVANDDEQFLLAYRLLDEKFR